eukprot:160911-Hanusia_phi.AAC.1
MDPHRLIFPFQGTTGDTKFVGLRAKTLKNSTCSKDVSSHDALTFRGRGMQDSTSQRRLPQGNAR